MGKREAVRGMADDAMRVDPTTLAKLGKAHTATAESVHVTALAPLAKSHTAIAEPHYVAPAASKAAPAARPGEDGKPGTQRPPADGKPGATQQPVDDKGRALHPISANTPPPKGDQKPSDGVGEHYGKPIELVPPPGASQGLTSFVALAETVIQISVDLLGRGITAPPPSVNSLLTTVTYKNLGKGTASDAYQETLTKVQSRQSYLLNMDSEVVKTAIKVAAGKDETLSGVRADVKQLQEELAIDLRPLSKKVKAAKELDLLEKIADTLDSVYKRVSAVAEFNKGMADGGKGSSSGKDDGTGSGNSGTSDSTGSSGGAANGTAAGSGDGGLGGIAQMLGPLAMMLPMGLMSLAPMVQQFIQNNAMQHQKEEEERKAQEAQAQEAQPGAATQAGAAPAADPSAAPAVMAQPGGVTADPAVITSPALDGPTANGPAPVAPSTAPEGTSAPSVTAPATGSIPGLPG